ncbi:MAG: hypothetical protein LBO77_05270 [Desulfovibrio sp.]|nr:hypothetical protein [Desulfovibrio sp.]
MKLFITPRSLRLHLIHLRKKLGVHSNREFLHILRKTPEHATHTPFRSTRQRSFPPDS